MSDIKATGIDLATGNNRPVEASDALVVNTVQAYTGSGMDLSVGTGQSVTMSLGGASLQHFINGFDEIEITNEGTHPIWIHPGNTTETDQDGQTLFLWSGNADGIGTGGNIDLRAGTGGNQGRIHFSTDGENLWFIEHQTGDPDYGASAAFKATDNSGIIEGATGNLSTGDDVIIRGGPGSGGGAEGGGNSIITGGSAEPDGNAGGVYIGSYLHTLNSGGEGYRVGTTEVVIGAEDNPNQSVRIYNFYTPTMSVGGTDNDVQPLMLLQPGYQTFGPNTGVVLEFGPVYYDPNTGETIRLGPNTVYINNDGADNFVRGEDGNELYDTVLHTLDGNDATYDLADNSISPPSPIQPGTVTLRVILQDDINYTTVTDNGAGSFPSGAVLPSGGTIDYTTGDMTGITASLEGFSRVTALYRRANASGEPLTPRAGHGTGTGVGGELRLRAGNGGTSGAIGGNAYMTGGDAGGTDQNGSTVTVKTGGGTGTGNPGSVRLQTSSIEASGTTTQTAVDRVYINGIRKALTNNTPVNLFDVSLTSGQMAGGYVTFNIRASDGSDFQARSGEVYFSGINQAGTITTSATAGTTDTSASAGTLAQTWASAAGTNEFTISLNANSSLTTTVLDIMYTIHLDSVQTVTIL